MTSHLPAQALQDKAQIVAAPLRRNRGERVFDLHPAVHLATVGAYLGFIAILATAFMGPDLIVPTAIFVVGIIALFLVPAWWARVVPDDGLRKQSWAEFLEEGVECCTGKLTSGQALAQVLVLPGLIVSLGLVMAIIKALV